MSDLISFLAAYNSLNLPFKNIMYIAVVSKRRVPVALECFMESMLACSPRRRPHEALMDANYGSLMRLVLLPLHLKISRLAYFEFPGA